MEAEGDRFSLTKKPTKQRGKTRVVQRGKRE